MEKLGSSDITVLAFAAIVGIYLLIRIVLKARIEFRLETERMKNNYYSEFYWENKTRELQMRHEADMKEREQEHERAMARIYHPFGKTEPSGDENSYAS